MIIMDPTFKCLTQKNKAVANLRQQIKLYSTQFEEISINIHRNEI